MRKKKKNVTELIDELIVNMKPARVPKGLWLWSDKMILAWLRSNQKTIPSAKRT